MYCKSKCLKLNNSRIVKKKIFVVLICFTALSCKELTSVLVTNTSIGKYVPDGALYVKKDYAKINSANKIVVFVFSNVVINNNNKSLSLSEYENNTKFLNSNYYKDAVSAEIKQMVVDRYQSREVIIKLDRDGISDNKSSLPNLNKQPDKKYAFSEYRHLKQNYNADIVIELELFQTIDILETVDGTIEYNLSFTLDTSYIDTKDNSFIYNEDLKSKKKFIDKSPFFDTSAQLQKIIKETYIELTSRAL